MDNKLKDFKLQLKKKFLPYVKDAQKTGLSEANLQTLIIMLLREVLGYRIGEDIFEEYPVSGKFVDIAVKAPLRDKKSKKTEHRFVFFVETKSVDTILKPHHASQVIHYAIDEGVSLCVLTNGIDFRVYHLLWDKAKVDHKIDHNDLMSFNILEDPLDTVAEKLFRLSKQSFKKGVMEVFIKEYTCTLPSNLARALSSERVIRAVKKELAHITGYKVTEEAIKSNLSKLFEAGTYPKAKSKARKSEKENKVTSVHPETLTS